MTHTKEYNNDDTNDGLFKSFTNRQQVFRQYQLLQTYTADNKDIQTDNY